MPLLDTVRARYSLALLPSHPPTIADRGAASRVRCPPPLPAVRRIAPILGMSVPPPAAQFPHCPFH
ncbi:hypothetical protein B0H17DRAFT_1099111 [Mycena rosella]|uniref:Uncharacterized protein n=1 Tax=Mycena rosella TaxID=1033263 RepID=A0AAD7CNS8_MYCRO|nr:hypothetical protein B0H17DRAFT_1099111 [Mycena rosella]